MGQEEKWEEGRAGRMNTMNGIAKAIFFFCPSSLLPYVHKNKGCKKRIEQARGFRRQRELSFSPTDNEYGNRRVQTGNRQRHRTSE